MDGTSPQLKRCVHFYACICAFASDSKLSEEFSYYINLDQTQSSIEKPLTIVPQNEDKIVGIGKIVYYIIHLEIYFIVNDNIKLQISIV